MQGNKTNLSENLPNVVRFCIYGKTYALEFYDASQAKKVVMTLNAEIKKLYSQIWDVSKIDELRRNLRKHFECEIFELN